MNFFTANTAPQQIHAIATASDTLAYVALFGGLLYIAFLFVSFTIGKVKSRQIDKCFCDIPLDDCAEGDCPVFLAACEALEDAALHGIAQQSTVITDPWEMSESMTKVFEQVQTFLDISDRPAAAQDLEPLNIRKLKSLASLKQVVGYGNMRKSELIKALAGKVSLSHIENVLLA